MAFQIFALPGDVEIERFDRAAVTEGSGLGVADTATLVGSDRDLYEALTTTYTELYFLEGEITYGPYDIVSVSERGEAGVWTVQMIENYYWEQRVAALPVEEETGIQRIFENALRAAAAGEQPFAGWDEGDVDLILSFMTGELDGATEWDALVGAAEKWGLTAYTEREPGVAPVVTVIPRYPTDGGSTGARVAVPWMEYDQDSRQRTLRDRANPVGGWEDRKIISSSRTFIDAQDIVTIEVGTREPALFLDLEEDGLAKIREELARWKEQNECESLRLTFPLRPDQHMGQVRSHNIVTIEDIEGEWRVVSVEGAQEGTRRSATLQLYRWQGYFERQAIVSTTRLAPVTPEPVGPPAPPLPPGRDPFIITPGRTSFVLAINVPLVAGKDIYNIFLSTPGQQQIVRHYTPAPGSMPPYTVTIVGLMPETEYLVTVIWGNSARDGAALSETTLPATPTRLASPRIEFSTGRSGQVFVRIHFVDDATSYRIEFDDGQGHTGRAVVTPAPGRSFGDFVINELISRQAYQISVTALDNTGRYLSSQPRTGGVVVR